MLSMTILTGCYTDSKVIDETLSGNAAKFDNYVYNQEKAQQLRANKVCNK